MILFQTLYLPTGFFIGRRFTSFSVCASYTTSAPSPTPEGEVPQPISRPNSCRLYNGMVLEGVGNRAFYARCGVSTEIWILSPNT